MEDIRRIELLRKDYKDSLKFVGEANMALTAQQEESLKWASKSAMYKSNFKKGKLLNLEDLDFKRPGTGLNYVAVSEYLGKPVTKDVVAGERVSKSDFK